MKLLLIGAGNMGGAMLGRLDRRDMTVVEANAARAAALKERYPEIRIRESIPSLEGYVVILAVKPQSLDAITFRGEAEALISILAGTSLARLREKIAARAYIRAMPNLAALHQKSVTSVTGDTHFKEEALALLSSIGKPIWLENETELDIATGLGGSAPAWLALAAEAMVEGAVELGLSRQSALAYLPMLLEGTGALLAEEEPADLIRRVSSPGGTTVAGLEVLRAQEVPEAFRGAIEAAFRRAQELGQTRTMQ